MDMLQLSRIMRRRKEKEGTCGPVLTDALPPRACRERWRGARAKVLTATMECR